MSDGKSILSPFAPPSTEADYDAICAAVLETARGRWFLAEYAKRNRHADTDAIIAAIDRIEARLVNGQDMAPSERVRGDLKDMAQAIARTRTEIAAIKPEGAGNGALMDTTVELDSIVNTTERATSDILAAAEQIQEIAWTAREQGVEAKICDALDQRATDVYTACTFQDLTGQRIRKVIEVLSFLEQRIAAMTEIWGQSDGAHADAGPRMPHISQAGDRLDQAEVDRIMPAPSPVAQLDQPARHDPHVPAHTDAQQADNPQVEPAVPPLSLPTPIATQEEAPEVPRREPAPGGGAADPAAVLDRILALVRVSMSDSDAPTASAPSERRHETRTELVLPPLAVEAAEPAARVEKETEAVPELAAAPSQPAKPETAAPVDDSDDDILMPLPGPISVADAVEQMLMKEPARPSPVERARNVAILPPAIPPEREPRVPQPLAAEPIPAEPAADSSGEQSGATAVLPRSFALDVPELRPEPAVEPAETPAPPRSEEPAAPEPPPPPLHAEESAADPVVATPIPEPPASPPPVAPVRPAAPLPALAALSEEEKIALFS